jgi:hypothetical protein
MSALTDTLNLSNGQRIPAIGFGTWLLKDGDEGYNAVADALRLGYRHIDTAAGSSGSTRPTPSARAPSTTSSSRRTFPSPTA